MLQRVDVEDCDLYDDLVLHNGQPFTGLLFSLYEDGSVEQEEEFQNGLPHGVCQEFYNSGKLKRTWLARNGRAAGKLSEYYENGVTKLEEIHEFGAVLSSRKWDERGNLIETKELEHGSNLYAYVEECRKRQSEGEPVLGREDSANK